MTKLPAHLHLDKLQIPYEVMSFSPDIDKGAASVANTLGFRERQMIKTLVFQTDKGECALIMVGGDQNVISGKLKKALGSRNISMAKPDVVIDVTGYAIGSIPPFHWQPDGFRNFLDEAMMDENYVGVGAGIWGNEIIMTPQDLVKATDAIVVNLCDPER